MFGNFSRAIWQISTVSLAALLIFSASTPRSKAAASLRQQQDEKAAAAQKLYDEAVQLYQQRTVEALNNAVLKLEKALLLLRELNNQERQALVLLALGRINHDLEEDEKALRFYSQSLPLWRAIGDPGSEATTLINIGGVYALRGEKQKALESYGQALPLLRSIPDYNGEGMVLHKMGKIYEVFDEKQKALDLYTQALPLMHKASNRGGEATVLNDIGAIYSTLGEKQKALNAYSEALPLWRAIKNRGGEAATLSNIGGVHSALGEKQKALDFYTQALSLVRAIDDRRSEATLLNNIGLVHFDLGESLKALAYYNQSLPLLRILRNPSGEARTLINIGGVHSALGEKPEAINFYNQALSLSRNIDDRTAEAKALNGIGYEYSYLGEKQKALDFLTQSLPLLRSISDRSGEGRTLNNIGNVYSELGEKQKALDFFTQSLPLLRAASDRAGEATAIGSIAAIYFDLGESQKALDFYAQALPIFQAIGNRREEAKALNNMGVIYSNLGENQKALDSYTKALPLRRAIGDRGGEAATLSNIGRMHSDLGDRQKALDLYVQALSLNQAVDDRRGESKVLANIAYTEQTFGRLSQSRSHIEECLKIIESLRASVVSQELRASYFATVQTPYEFYISLLMQMHEQGPLQGNDAAALHAVERTRARSLLENLIEARTDTRQGVDSALLERERAVQQKLNAKAEARFKTPTSAESQTAALNREIDALTTELQQVQTQIRQASPRYAALTQPQPLNVAEIQQQVLDAETLLLEYSLGAERSFVWAVTPTSLASYELPKREMIEAAAREVYELMTARNKKTKEPETDEQKRARIAAADRAYPAAAARLSQMLLAPVAQHLGKKRLAIVADGALHYLPFGALPDPTVKATAAATAQSRQPLLVEHEVVNLPSASTLAVLRRELKGRAPAAKTLAVIADPVFTRTDERFRAGAAPVAKVAAKAEPTLRELANAQVVRKLIPTASGDLDIPRLKHTRDEANALMALTSAREAMQALDFDATRALVEGGGLSQYRYVHFATHGLADSERADLSTILLSLFDAQGRPVDGFLRAHEVYNLNLPAEMVVLSACETGLGKLYKGEGLVSLTRGFMYAGAARVVVSLWAVSDKATAELMTKFYRKVLVEGERPAAALRAAQVEMWKTEKREAPYYWAAFTLQGEWR
ncbi:MAG TPA: tetratricopeptide repeat protein [Blastocatellia bacterium]|nr:tetratricopeptide repeat protein [Blastocatellia bacterium]